jgi:hypothetical protein
MIREFQVDTDQPLPELSELINRLIRDRRSDSFDDVVRTAKGRMPPTRQGKVELISGSRSCLFEKAAQ